MWTSHAPGRHSALGGPGAEALDDRHVVRAEDGARAAAARRVQERAGELQVRGVGLAQPGEGDAGRLGVGALHQADGGAQREERGRVGRGAAEVRLQAEAHAVVLGAHAAEDVEGGVHVARLLHVDRRW
jgi:hypothetical protein